MLSKFTSNISIINGNPYVTPPDSVLEIIFEESGKSKGPIPIRGKINGAKFQQTLVRYQVDWRLYVNIIMCKAAGIKFTKSISEIVGTTAAFEIEFDPSPPKFEMLPFFEKALNENPKAKENWEKLIPSRKKEILRYLSWLTSEEAKDRNVAKAISALNGNEERFMARSWRGGK